MFGNLFKMQQISVFLQSSVSKGRLASFRATWEIETPIIIIDYVDYDTFMIIFMILLL